MQIITTGLVFVNVAAEAQLIAVGLVLILAAVIDQTGSSSLGRRLVSLLFKTRSKHMERIINVRSGDRADPRGRLSLHLSKSAPGVTAKRVSAQRVASASTTS